MGTGNGAGHVARWGRTERTAHWIHAAAFCVLLGSGLCLYLPSLAEAIGRRPLLKTIHIYTALAWAIALVLVVVVGDRRAIGHTVREVDSFDADDRAWLRGRHVPQGRLNAGQKVNTIVSSAFAILFAASGFDLWYGERDTRFRLANALLVHDYLMYASLFLFLGHLWFALILPKTRHSLNGMTRGWVREDWAAERHPKWVAALDARSLEPSAAPGADHEPD
jgi:formate dehydrogenase subunit gamma